jgi:nitrogen regulatory protein PII
MQEALESGKGTKFFYSKTNTKNKKEKIQSLLELDDIFESEKFEQKVKLRITKQFYEQLWRDCRTEEKDRSALLGNINKKINKKQRNKLEQKMTIEEIEFILNKKIQANKAPGWDGIPATFYKKFEWSAQWLTEVYNEIIEQQQLPTSMQTAVVTLLFKKGDRNQIGNYRPISLLCDDYKIFTKVLSERMKAVLNTIIQTSQQGFVGGGDIRGSVIQVQRIIEYCEEENLDTAIVFMDFQKAFDKVDHKCIEEVLTKFNFGPNFTSTVMALYRNVKSRVVVNGELTEEVHIKGGVRQGCPLSAYLFICVLELLARRVQTDSKLNGITEPVTGQSSKISLFADDAAAFIENVTESITVLRAALRDYEKATGAKLHDTKTVILKLGSNKVKHLDFTEQGVQFEIMKNDQVERYLGDAVGSKVSEEKRFAEQLTKMEKTGNRWRREQIGLHSRALVANTIMLQAAKYRASFHTVSATKIEEIRKIQEDFLWQKKKGSKQRPRRAWQHVIQPYEKGGLKMLDPRCSFDAEKIGILQRANNNKLHPWVPWKKKKDKELRQKWGIVGDITKIKPNTELQWNESDLFEKTYQVWHSIGTSKEAGTEKFAEARIMQGIWWNPNITDEQGESYYNKKLADKGILTILQFLNYYIELENKERTENQLFEIVNKATEYATNEQEDKQNNQGSKIGITTMEGEWKEFDKIKSQDCYKLLLNIRFPSDNIPNAAITKVRKKLTTRELDYWWNLLHNLVPTRAQMLHFQWSQQKIKTRSNKCALCNNHKETRTHMNGECEQASELFLLAATEHPDIGAFSIEKWNCTEDEATERETVLIAKLRYQLHKHRMAIMRKTSPSTNLEIVISNWKIEIENFDNNFDKSELQKKLDYYCSN